MPNIYYAQVNNDNICTTVSEYAQALNSVPTNYITITSFDLNLKGKKWTGSSWESTADSESEARAWRDEQLRGTDDIVAILDHPIRDNILAYRILLRNWPSTSDFPATKPVIGG
tara:strand:+ start:23 stop:364 length:342 start_codon:yes stop_codon:yes gene_type:complete